MNTSYTFSYPCKTISNFCSNFLGEHFYDEIKEITFRKRKIETSREKFLFDLFLLFQNIGCLPFGCGWKEYKDTYFRVFGEQTGDDYDWIENNDGDDLYSNTFKFCKQTNENYKLLFLCFLYFQNAIGARFDYCIVLPPTLRADCLSVNDADIGKYFLKGWLRELFAREKYDLKKDICAKYSEIKDELAKKEIEAIYLFGSVYKGMTHNDSDIDLIVKCKNTAIDGLDDAKNFLKEFNYTNFKRGTDVHNYYDYVNFYDINDTLKLV